MAKFCTACGKEIATGVAFCTECGAKAPADPVTETPEPLTKPKMELKSEATVHTPPPAPDHTNKVVGTGTYFGLMILFAIPLIGFLACILMVFTAKNKNIKNFARATLIWMIIAAVLTGILIALISLLANSLINYIHQFSEGHFGDFGEVGNMTKSLENGGLVGLPLE